MANHPNRSKKTANPAANPKPDEIRALREDLGLTQAQAAAVVYSTLSAWQRWEQAERAMHPAMWELFRIKTGVLDVGSVTARPSLP
ncbi:helix-turn-helix domain-containing protein [Burkholderia pseudomallei]|uniref:helix-turn-helix domain-containing protein n=1 Tax=Burkholderia pseudomallei TaxID=28450 RepID=UPI0022EB3E3F|nr:helix-turn-helix domain-containing protein [Burkholderia pseudomallei]